MFDGPILSLSGLTKRFGGTVAVQAVTAEIRCGELVSFVGPSGCGKTTLLRLVGGFLRPDAGTVHIEGDDITSLPPNLRPTAMVFQNYALFPHLNVAENIGYALAIRRYPKAEVIRRVAELLDLVQLQGLGNRRPAQLSGGQQQRVALARALSLQPKVLLLDEPLSNLDAGLRVQMRGEIKRLQRELALTVVFVTHDQEEAMGLSDRILVMNAGRILQAGAPAEVYERPTSAFVARFIGGANFLEGILGNGHPGPLQVETTEGCLTIRTEVAGLAHGARVHLVIRPEAIRLQPQVNGAGPNRLRGRIEAAMYAGALIRYTVGVGSLSLTVDQADPRHSAAFREGDAVTVLLPDDPHILPAP
jgi:ABC-type Fe3+/spermidine/putrescine transport system ATPase subunit